jgi:hypothetical protein
MKKPALATYHLNNRLAKIEKIKQTHGTQIRKMIVDGYTIGDIVKHTQQPKKALVYYLESEGLRGLCDANWLSKRSELARVNGRQSKQTLAGVELKPLNMEVKQWFKDQLATGKFKWQIRKELHNKFGYGEKKYYQLCKEFGTPQTQPNTGQYNPMFGKSPSKLSGIGVKGWVFINGNKLFFRSSLELKVFLHLEQSNISFIPANHRVSYDYLGSKKTYLPDIVIETTVYEIKPSAMLNNELVNIKYTALKQYCNQYNLSCGFITESTYPMNKLTRDDIDGLIEKKKLVIDQKNYNKLMRYL